MRTGISGICTVVVDDAEANTCAAPSVCLALGSCAAMDQRARTNLQRFQGKIGGPEAQTFTAGRSGQMVAVRIAVGCADGEQFLLQIQSATASGPDGTVLSTQVLVGPSHFGDNEDELIHLTTAVPVTAGRRYAFVIARSGGNPCTVVGGAGEYPGGESFYQSAPDVTWIADPKNDIDFTTYVAP
jgi:hypothetical protein